jgi:RNA polymerase sigma-70 factor (ECF subfamily)
MENEKILKRKISEENDTGAFRELYDFYFNPLFNIGYSILHNREITKELVSDVFISLWNTRDHLSHITNLDSYLFVAIKNQCMRYLTRHKMERFTNSFDDNITLRRNIDFNSPDRIVEFEELKLKYDNVISRLPTKCKMVFELVKVEGKKYKEVAAIMSISIKTVENHMLKAMKSLREEFRMEQKCIEKNKAIF